jgi:hypothetical protein
VERREFEKRHCVRPVCCRFHQSRDQRDGNSKGGGRRRLRFLVDRSKMKRKSSGPILLSNNFAILVS